MLDAYDDIRDRIAETPQWWDRHGVPRYHAPIPQNCSHVYADQVAFVEIECQHCGEAFVVEFASSMLDRIIHADRYKAHVGKEPEPYDPTKLHYGDPPRHSSDRCMGGDTMNSVPRRVVTAWEKERFDWTLTHDNVPMICEWMEADRGE